MNDSDDFQDKLQKQHQIYKRIKVLGSGSFGKAFLVKRIEDETLWVVKQINIADMSPEEQQGAMKQAKVLELLDHPNIVKFRQVYNTHKMKLNIVMEYADGGDLGQKIKKAKETSTFFEESEILNWFVQICLGVKHIHDRKIIHRDLKAQNIFLTTDSMVKIGDFGVSKILESTMSKARTVVGSPYYLSPQIIQNKPYSYKTDIWSLGTLLFQMCALVPPFTANNIQFLALKIVKGNYAQISNKYSLELRNLIKSMLHTKQNLRPNINQILASRIITNQMNKMISCSKFIEVVKQEKVRIPSHSTHSFYTLKPPPNLLNMQDDIIENKSEVISHQSQDQIMQVKAKVKTPQINTKKGPNNFFNRPTTARKIEEKNNLGGIMQIKPSHLEVHEKHEKPNLPKVPIKPKRQQQPFVINKEKQLTKTPISAFSKKRPSLNPLEQEASKAEPRFEIESRGFARIKETKEMKDKSPPVIKVIKNLEANGQKKPQIRKKCSVSAKPKKTNVEQKLQICSQQVKKKAFQLKKIECDKKQKKKKEGKIKKKNQEKKQAQVQENQIMEEEKCNSENDLNSNNSSSVLSDDYYTNDVFESYEQTDEQDSVELQFSQTLSERGNPNQFQQMIKQMENIKKLVDQAEGNVDSLPMIGEEIPEIIHFSSEIREDDSELESNQSSSDKKLEQNRQSLQVKCIYDHGELQNLRINLQQIFGEESIIFAYKLVEQKVSKYGLDFDEEETISQILNKNSFMDQCKLRQFFRLIVTIISLQNEIV